jgi:peptidoglycan/LPS O-acetylase OafA/YrhL
MPKRAADGRFLELDVLRGAAAFSVLLFHYLTRYNQLYALHLDVPFRFDEGPYGVQLFFVISGFVIFMTLRRCDNAADFVVSRFSRLYPAFWGAVLLTYAVGTLWPLPGQHYTPAQLAINLTMMQDLTAAPAIDGVYWSLDIELCFYGVMLALFLSGALANTARLSVLWLGAALANHLLPTIGIEIPHRLQTAFVLNYAELFVAGINFYEIHARGPSAGRAALITACLLTYWADNGTANAERILLIFALVALAVSGRLRFLCVRPLVWLGTISYSLYLTHQMIGYAVLYRLTGYGVPSTYAIPAAIAIALALASALTLTVERPAMRAIRQLYRYYRATVPARLPVA